MMLQNWLLGISSQTLFLLIFAILLLGAVAVGMLVWLYSRHIRLADGGWAFKWGTILLLLFFMLVSALAAFYSYSYFHMVQNKSQSSPPTETLVEQMKAPAAPAAAAQTDSEQAEKKENEEFDLKTSSQQALSRRLMAVEREMRSQLASDDDDIAAVDEQYQAGQLDTYDQLVSKARLEIRKRDHIINSMNEKIALIQNSEALDGRAKIEALHGNVTRKSTAMQERTEYEAVLEQVESHKEDYKNL